MTHVIYVCKKFNNNNVYIPVLLSVIEHMYHSIKNNDFNSINYQYRWHLSLCKYYKFFGHGVGNNN